MHGWDRVGGGMHGVGQNRVRRACMGWDRIGGGHAWGGAK